MVSGPLGIIWIWNWSHWSNRSVKSAFLRLLEWRDLSFGWLASYNGADAFIDRNGGRKSRASNSNGNDFEELVHYEFWLE
jgi:hypothetical protein